jgi:hypothetical protein
VKQPSRNGNGFAGYFYKSTLRRFFRGRISRPHGGSLVNRLLEGKIGMKCKRAEGLKKIHYRQGDLRYRDDSSALLAS